jgi:hypothetical protein
MNSIDTLPTREKRRPRHGDRDCRTAGCCWSVDDLGALGELVVAA